MENIFCQTTMVSSLTISSLTFTSLVNMGSSLDMKELDFSNHFDSLSQHSHK